MDAHVCPHCGEDCRLPPPRWTSTSYLAIMEAQGIPWYEFATCGRGRRADREALGYNMVDLLRTRVQSHHDGKV